MIDKDTGEVPSNRLGEKYRGHGGVHAAGEGAKRASAADPFAEFLDRFPDERPHMPCARAAADIVDEVPQNLRTVLRMHNLRMELNGIETPRRMLHRRDRTDGRTRRH